MKYLKQNKKKSVMHEKQKSVMSETKMLNG